MQRLFTPLFFFFIYLFLSFFSVPPLTREEQGVRSNRSSTQVVISIVLDFDFDLVFGTFGNNSKLIREETVINHVQLTSELCAIISYN